MSIENNKVCCNCRHNIRQRDKKYNIVINRCEILNEYMSYMEVMECWCKHWAKEKEEEKK